MAMNFDLSGFKAEEINRLLELLVESDIQECEIEQGDAKISVKRAAGTGAFSSTSQPTPAPEPDSTADGMAVIRADAVGFFYRAESRSSPPRVEDGGKVKAGDIIGYIEVMRVPHGVLSTQEGTVESFLIDDGEPVEYGQPIVSIQPSAVSRH